MGLIGFTYFDSGSLSLQCVLLFKFICLFWPRPSSSFSPRVCYLNFPAASPLAPLTIRPTGQQMAPRKRLLFRTLYLLFWNGNLTKYTLPHCTAFRYQSCPTSQNKEQQKGLHSHLLHYSVLCTLHSFLFMLYCTPFQNCFVYVLVLVLTLTLTFKCIGSLVLIQF